MGRRNRQQSISQQRSVLGILQQNRNRGKDDISIYKPSKKRKKTHNSKPKHQRK